MDGRSEVPEGRVPGIPSPEAGGAIEVVCENCAFPDEELALVRRVYVTPETWDTPASSRVVETAELWCTSCRSQYPHEPVEG